MDTYVTIQNITIPIYFILILLEAIFARRMGKSYISNSMDSLASLASGTTFLVKTVLGFGFGILSYEFLVNTIALFQAQSTILNYCLAFLGIDFAVYWRHRIRHRINYFWNHHVIHHSSEEFNLACALRQPVSTLFTTYFILLFPMALCGIPVEMIALLTPIHLSLQFWYHTRLIDKLGVLEKVLVTPSHHRVHHATNDIYLDKNLSSIFIIWDKLFGTFQEELTDEPPIYGVKRPVKTWNPFLINFQHLGVLIQDAWRTKSYFDKLRIWFMPTGWRPVDQKLQYPLSIPSEPDPYDKYAPAISLKIKIWSWLQYSLLLLLVFYFINNASNSSLGHNLAYAAFLYLSIYSITSSMNGHKLAWMIELLRSTFGLGIIAYFRMDWFFLSSISINLVIILGIYLLLSTPISLLLKYLKR